MNKVAVSELLGDDAKHLKLELLYGKAWLDSKFISSFRIQKPGLGLAGYTDHIHGGRVQILGNTEISYLQTLTRDDRYFSISELCKKDIACFVVTKNLKVPSELLTCVKKHNIPLMRTALVSSEAITKISDFLEYKLAPETVIHGVLMDVYGVGVLIIGRSGIGKSECALELIKRGHRLAADDAVHIIRKQDFLIGASNDLLHYHIELRGLGILNVKDMYGVNAIRVRKKVELVVNFVDWNSEESYERTGLDNKYFEILGIHLPIIMLPVSPGRNMAVIVESAAKNQLLKYMGYDAAREFENKLNKKLKESENIESDSFFDSKGVE
ncbi:HPr(Ser) kinase/phosphatase [Flexistipes sp.]|uniref:HPr(Ser) kinase/phosphatase n=1 Tax=Flexistipes sp. TaxID=3088135 RepID=UPI002E1E03D8|nr:HPr(Ser) kinase/phosphatase [Flexistipes sp.]